MNICFFHSSMRAGGIERTISLLANMYAAMGDQISIITLDGENCFYQLSSEINYCQLKLSGKSKNTFHAIQANLKRIGALRKCLKRIRPDVVVTFGTSTELVAVAAKLGIPTKLVGAERANPYLYTYSTWNRYRKVAARLCDGFLFQTKGAASFYSEDVRKKSLVIANGIDGQLIESVEQAWEHRGNICAVGRMDADKGFDDIIRAFEIIHNAFPDIVLDLYGEGPKRKELETLAASAGLEKHVVFHGQDNEIFAAYASHKIFVMMSRQEGFPNVLAEAMASGCVCVAGDCDFGPSELIRDGENGYLVPVKDYEAAARKAIEILEDDARAEQMSIQAKCVRETNDIRVVGNTIRSYLDSLVEL